MAARLSFHPAELPAHVVYPRLEGVRFCGDLRVVPPEGGEGAAASAVTWELSGDRDMVMVGTKLFPGSVQRGGRELRFVSNVRVFQDLVWLMQRYPLRVHDLQAFETAFQECCAFLVKRARANRAHEAAGQAGDRIAVNAPATFHGTLKDFQEEGLAHMEANPRTILADDMGLGKTVQALALLALAQSWPALIVCQTHNQVQWIKQTHRFLGIRPDVDGGLKIHRIVGTRPGAKGLPPAHIYVTHYGLLRHWRQELTTAGVLVVIFDEIQELRKHDSKKYFAGSDISWRAERVIGLSDTPIYGYGAEMWSVMNAIDQQCLGTRDMFIRQWCENSDNLTDPDALGDFLRREGLLLRRTKEMVKSSVPPVHPMEFWVDGDEATFKKLNINAEHLRAEAAGQVTAFDRARLEAAAENAERRATGVAKVPDVIALVKKLLGDGERVLIGAWHHDVVDLIATGLHPYRVGRITGRENEKQKEAAKDAFTAGEIDVIIMNLRSGVGIDGLQYAASTIVNAELDWSPQVHRQFIGRLWREGQTNQVLAYFVVSPFGKDPAMMAVLGAKKAQYYGVMQIEAESEEQLAEHAAACMDRLDEVFTGLGFANDDEPEPAPEVVPLTARTVLDIQSRLFKASPVHSRTFLALERGNEAPITADVGTLADQIPDLSKALSQQEATVRHFIAAAIAAGMLSPTGAVIPAVQPSEAA